MRKSTVQAWVDYLNDLFKADRVAMTNLVGSRIHCNTTLANHPTCLIMDTDMGPTVGLLGIINGFLGVDADGNGPVCVQHDEHRCLGFAIYTAFRGFEDDC